MSDILEFRGDYRWLSNFWYCPVVLDGVTYPSTEHAYQAAKTHDPVWRQKIANAQDFKTAKHLGYKVPLRPDWEQVKLQVMEDLLRQKFAKGTEYGQLLYETSGRKLVEGNTWGDTYWGMCRGKGENHLGKLLMKIRQELT